MKAKAPRLVPHIKAEREKGEAGASLLSHSQSLVALEEHFQKHLDTRPHHAQDSSMKQYSLNTGPIHDFQLTHLKMSSQGNERKRLCILSADAIFLKPFLIHKRVPPSMPNLCQRVRHTC